MTVTFSPSIPSFVPHMKEPSYPLKWLELSLAITIIATVIILSCASILPAYFIFTAQVSLITTILARLIHLLLPQQISNKEKVEEAEEIAENHPIIPCVLLPVVEEGIFRGILQSGLQSLLTRFIPNTLIWSLTLPALLAIGITSVLFGAAHIPLNNPWQPLTAALNGVVYGLLFYHYGLPSAIFKHMIHNTIIYTLD